MSADLLPIDLAEMLAEVNREIYKRRQVFARMVEERRMNPRTMERRIAIFERLAALLQQQLEAATCRRSPTN